MASRPPLQRFFLTGRFPENRAVAVFSAID
jgi:hypothetical protein